MRLLEGKVAVVTGAGSGLGREYAIAFAQHGAAVIVNDFGASVDGERIQSNSADAVVEEIVSLGGNALANIASVADWEGAKSIIDTAVINFGRLDISFRFNSRTHGHKTTSRAGDCAADQQQLASFVDTDDVEVLGGHSVHA